jgi:F1F0 ATPase subunit 2
MTDPGLLALVSAWMAGCFLGAIFYGGLWWTVRRGVTSARPALWFFTSLLTRVALTLSGFYFVSGGQWQRALLCLIGFVMARVAVTWMTRTSHGETVGHAS